MFYLVYKTTNNINGKYYIGCHKTTDLDDGYFGSGKILKRALAKYGVESFSREIIGCFDNPSDMFDMEAILVNETTIQEKDNYNLKIGGEGGFDFINKTKKNVYKGHSEQARKNIKKALTKIRELEKDPDWVIARRAKGQKAKMAKYGTLQPQSFQGKKHTEETKRKIGIKNSKSQTGKGNSQYGTCWIYNECTSKKIKKEDLQQHIDEGWEKGRKLRF